MAKDKLVINAFPVKGGTVLLEFDLGGMNTHIRLPYEEAVKVAGEILKACAACVED